MIQRIKNFPWKQFLYLLGLMFVFGLFGILCGQDSDFDLQNYHFYNGFAFLFRSSAQDIMPAGIHSFFIPWLDALYYLNFRWFMNLPRVAAFVQGAIYGIYAFMIMQLCRFYLYDGTNANKYDWLFAWLVGISGTVGISQISISSGEIYEAILLCLSLWTVLKGSSSPRSERWFCAGILLAGLAFALKYTAAPFCVGLGAMVLYFWKKQRQSYRSLALYVLIGSGVIVLVDGWFWYKYFVKFGNPLFPFFNQIFKSPYFDPVNLIDKRFFPHHAWTWFLMPFYWMRFSVEMGSEVPLIDYRWACGFVSFWVLLIGGVYKRYKKQLQDGKIMGLLIFAGIGYLIWLRLFLILRYAVVLEGLLGLLMVLAARQAAARWKNYLLGILVVVFSLTTVYPDWGTEPFSEKVIVFYDFKDVPDNSLVLVQMQGISYVLPFLNPTASFIGGLQVVAQDYPPEVQKIARRRNALLPNFYNYHFEKDVAQKIAAHSGPIYLLTYYWPSALYEPALARWGIKGEEKNCHRFNSSWNKYFEYLMLCRVEKI